MRIPRTVHDALWLGLAVALIAIAAMGAAHAANDRAQARSIAEAAIAHIETVGLEQALEDFTVDTVRWAIPESSAYLYAYDFDGNCVAHAVNANQVGHNFLEFRDYKGRAPIRDGIAQAMTGEPGWVRFAWLSPFTRKVAESHSWIIRIPEHDLYLAGIVYE